MLLIKDYKVRFFYRFRHFQIVVTDQRFFDLFKKYDGYSKNEIKMKRPTQLMEVLELAREILHEQQVMLLLKLSFFIFEASLPI